MPPDIRKERVDCPGELDGVCVKMMQKDPKFRYTSCLQVAEILEAWLKKYREETKDNPSKHRDNNLSVTDILDGKVRSQQNIDTVTNRGSGTIGGKMNLGSAVVSLSASDSGVLRAIAKSDASSIDSKIDLVRDTSKPNAQKSKSQAIAKANSPMSGPQKASGSGSPLVKPMEKPKSAAGPTIASKTAVPKNKSNTAVIITVIAIVLILGVGIIAAIIANR
jgi:hypothetical protein